MTNRASTARKFRFRLGHKVLVGYVLVTVIMVAYAVVMYSFAQRLQVSNRALVEENNRTVALSYEMEAAILKMSDGHRGFILSGNDLYLDPYMQGSQSIGDILKELMSKRQGNQDQLRRLSTITTEVARWRAEANKQIADRRNATDLADYLRNLSLVSANDTMFKVNTNMREFRAAEAEQMSTRVQANAQLINLMRTSAQALPLVTLIVGLLSVGTVTRSMTRRMQVVEQAAQQIAAGDLSGSEIRVKGSDEAASLAAAFNELRSNLRSLISMTHGAAMDTRSSAEALIDVANQAASASGQIADEISVLSEGAQHQAGVVLQASQVVNDLEQAVSQIAAGAQQQAGAMNDVSVQFREMAVAIDEVAEQAEAVAEVSQEAATLAQTGSASVVSTVGGMERIKETAQAASHNVSELGRRSREIEALVGDIQAIASQTNLLALNAAIEAARAGEHGRGFAVVADQVRKLAEDSRVAAQQIQSLASAIQTGTTQVVSAISAAESQADDGVSLARGAAENLRLILEAIERTAGAAQAIEGAVTEVRRRSAEVNEGISSTAAVTEQNTAATEEMSAGAEAAMHHLQQVSDLTSQSAASAQQVSAATEELTAHSEEVSRAAETLAETAQRLTSAIERFRM